MLISTTKPNVFVNTNCVCRLWIERQGDLLYKVMASLSDSTTLCLNFFPVKEMAENYLKEVVTKYNISI